MTEISKKDITPCNTNIENHSAQTVAETFVNAVSTFHWRYDFAKFCEVLELKPDKYAEHKWAKFRQLIDALNQFSVPHLSKLVDATSNLTPEVGSPSGDVASSIPNADLNDL